MEDFKQKITVWLSGPRNYQEGVELYRLYGCNLRLKKQFAIEEPSLAHPILVEELRQLSGLTPEEFKRLPRLAYNSGKSRALTPAEITLEVKIEQSDYEPTTAPAKKMLRFRERYPFLSEPDCPDVLKILVSDMFTAYGRYKEAHARLRDAPDSEDTTADCRIVVEEYLKNRAIREELEYYREHHRLLGKYPGMNIADSEEQPAEDLTLLTDVELLRRLQSAKANVSKPKKALEGVRAKGQDPTSREEALARWNERKRLLQEETDRRKKSERAS